ncbi:MAG: RHS repeat-associated core domain-containing protein, partial [Clostridiaceae bacterium]|nr:RHS repeat-associated core domain-containing protein [Clostridiaceae bacterium]
IIAGKPVTITVNASDNAKVTLVEADADGVPLALDENRKCIIIPDKPGTLVITAKAYDAAGNIGTATRNITVQEDTSAPYVSISSASKVAAGSPFTITVNASDNVGVTAIETDFDGVPVTLDENNKYTHIPTSDGTIVITAKAYDRAGNVSEAKRTVTVTADTVKPVVTLTVDKETVNAGESVSFTATATDNVGIAKIEAFFEDKEIILDTDGNANFKPTQSGKIIVNAYDHKGNIGKAEKTITVIEVIEPEEDYEKPVVKLEMSSNVINVGDTVTIKVTATDNSKVESVQAEVYGTPVLLDITGMGTVEFEKAGIFEVVAKATDTAGNEGYALRELLVKNPGDTTPPQASVTSPESNTKISAPVDITGTAFDENLAKYVLEYSEKGKNQYIKFAEGTSNVKDGVLGKLDTTMMRNGQYDIRLSVYDKGGYVVTFVVTYTIEGEQKVGNFSIGFDDLTVPVSGLPITVSRTYDSRRKTKGDFGIGWSMEVQDIRIEESVVPGQYWLQESSGGGLLGITYNVYETQEHTITVAYPDGKVDEFDMVLSPATQQIVQIQWTNVSFVARQGTHSKLEAIDVDNQVYVMGDGLTTFDDEYYNPNKYRLTTKEGTVFVIDQKNGVESITDTNGNKVTYGRDGIKHSTGKSITFDRDSQGRITKITDPMNKVINYEYDYYGDLVKVTDQEGNVTRFTYNSSHGLLEIIDPRGIKPARNEYDDSGRLTAYVDANGKRVEYTHDVNSRQEIIKDRLGNIMVLSYDKYGNILESVDADGNKTSYTYDNKNNKLSETDALGRTMTYTYDNNNNLLSSTDAMGNKTEYTYNAKGQLLTSKDPMGNTTTCIYDNNGNVLSMINSDGSTTKYTYTSTGNIETITDTTGEITEYTYDKYGNLTEETHSSGNKINYSYDGNGNILTKTTERLTPSGVETLTTTYKYDALNRIIESVDPLGFKTKFEYNFAGEQSAVTDNLGNRIEYEYDTFGNLSYVYYPDGTNEKYSYDEEGRKLTFTDREGKTKSYGYDKQGRVIKTTFPDKTFTQTEYDAAGQIIKETDENGNATYYEYDDGGRNISIKDAMGYTTTYGYDKNGRKTKMTDANGNTTLYEYNDKECILKTIYADGTSTLAGYDERKQKTFNKDQAGKITEYKYNAKGNLMEVTDPLTKITAYDYDVNGNLVSQTDANGNVTKFEYDKLGRKIRNVLPLGMTETTEYDYAGNIISATNYNGEIINHKYDVNGNLIRTVFPDGGYQNFTYTQDGKRKSVEDSRGITTYEYDLRDRLIKQTNPDKSWISYTYDAVGNCTGVTVPSGTTKNEYDSLNRLVKVTAPDGGITTYTYDGVGNRKSINYPNGTVTRYDYDKLNRLIKLENIRSDGQIIASYVYTLGPSGNRTKVEENNGRVVEYTYDDTYRLLKEEIKDPVSGDKIIEYTYDSAGNRLTKTEDGIKSVYTYDKNDRLLSDGTYTYTYDKNGNTLTRSGSGESVAYTYNWYNKLIKAVATNASGVKTTTEYQYDADGNRVSKIVNGTKTSIYLVDSNMDYAQVLEERDEKGNLIVSYVHGDDLISQKRGDTTSFYHYDGAGSVRALTNSSQSITDTYTYDAFGLLINRTGSTENEYMYSGEQYDPNIGFYYLRARWFDPYTGRFTSMDSWNGSLFDPPSLHKYVYCHNNPVDNSDPSGLFILTTALAGFAQNMWARTANIRSALTTYWKAQSTIEKVKLGIAATCVAIGTIFPQISRNSLSYSFKLYEATGHSWPDIGIEIRYGDLKGGQRRPIELRLKFAAGKLTTRFTYDLENNKFAGVSGELKIYSYKFQKLGIFQMKCDLVMETTGAFSQKKESFPSIALLGINFSLGIGVGKIGEIAHTVRSPRFDIPNLRFAGGFAD